MPPDGSIVGDWRYSEVDCLVPLIDSIERKRERSVPNSFPDPSAAERIELIEILTSRSPSPDIHIGGAA